MFVMWPQHNIIYHKCITNHNYNFYCNFPVLKQKNKFEFTSQNKRVPKSTLVIKSVSPPWMLPKVKFWDLCVVLVTWVIFSSTYDGKIQWSTSGIENVADFCHFVTWLNYVTFCPYMSLLGQSGVTGGALDPYNVHALFVNMDNMWMERFGNYDCLVLFTQLLVIWQKLLSCYQKINTSNYGSLCLFTQA